MLFLQFTINLFIRISKDCDDEGGHTPECCLEVGTQQILIAGHHLHLNNLLATTLVLHVLFVLKLIGFNCRVKTFVLDKHV